MAIRLTSMTSFLTEKILPRKLWVTCSMRCLTSEHAALFHTVSPWNLRWICAIESGRRGSIRRSSVWIGWSKQKGLMLQIKRWTMFGQYP